MNQDRTVFAQLMDFVPKHIFNRCVSRYSGHKWIQTFSCWDQFLCMAFAQMTNRRSLRDIEASLEAQSHKLYHCGFRSRVRRNTLSNANRKRDYRIYQDLAYCLIDMARPLYSDEDLGLDLKETVYALDATVIDLCLSLFPWAEFRRTKGGIKVHTLLDLQTSIPVFIDITSASVHEVNILDRLFVEPGAILVMDKGYTDFKRLYQLNLNAAYFIIRAKSNLRCRRIYSDPVDKSSGVQYDQTVRFTTYRASKNYPQSLRRVKYYDKEQKKTYVFLTNNFNLPAKTIADLYKYRWQIELFFKWIKQHLRIKSFYGNSVNAVKTQIWIAITVYVLAAIMKKQLNIEHNHYTILQILSVTLFEKVPILQILKKLNYNLKPTTNPNQLSLLD